MKPNFALSLSFDGIRLLHRTGTGWSIVGEVPLDTKDLAAELAVLRKTALALDPQGLRSKLLIPNAQIKYIALDTTRAQEADVRAALDGATPYAVDDLVYDFVRGGGRTYIAAVARETLAEAEAFAADYRFGPVSFAAVPEPFTYFGEPFFGATSIAATLLPPGTVIERDSEPVQYAPRQAARAIPSFLQATAAQPAATRQTTAPAEPTPEETARAEADLPSQEGKPAQTTPADPPAADQPLTLAPSAAPVAQSAAEGAATEIAEPDKDGTTPEITAPDAPAIAAAQAPGPGAAPVGKPVSLIPDPVFTTRGRRNGAELPEQPPAPPRRALGGAARLAETTDAAGSPQPVFGSRRDTEPAMSRSAPPELAVPVADKDSVTLRPPQLTGVERLGAGDPRAMPPATSAAPVPLRPVQEIIPDAAPPVTGRSSVAQPEDSVAPLQPAPGVLHPAQGAPVAPETVAPGPTTTLAAVLSGRQARAEPVPLARPDESAPAVRVAAGVLSPAPSAPRTVALRSDGETDIATTEAMSDTEADQLTVFGARRKAVATPARRRGRPRFLALILTAVLLLVMAAIGVFASIASDTGLARLWGRDPAPQVASDTGAAPAAATSVVDVTALAPMAATPPEQSLSAETLPAETTVPPAVTDADVPDPAPTAPDMIVDGSSGAIIDLPTDSEDSAALAAAAAVAAAAAMLDAATAPEPASPLPADPAPVMAAAPLVVETGVAISPAEAEQFYAATGVWLRAPRLPLVPQTTSTDRLVVAGLDPDLAVRVAAAMPALDGSTPDGVLMPQRDPPPRGTVFDRDEAGNIRATPEGVMTPDGIMVYAGRPAIVPPNRPGTPEAVAEPAIADPAAAPDGAEALVEADVATDVTTDDVSAGGVSLVALRPRARPEGIAPEIQAEPESAAEAPFWGQRPQLRPAGLAPPPSPEPEPEPVPEPEPEPASVVPAPVPAADVTATLEAIVAAAPPAPVALSPLAVARAVRPDSRPRNFDQVVARALNRGQAQPPAQQQPQQPPAQQQAAAPAAPQVVAPTGPVPGSVARAATMESVMNLREINLIGVFGRPNDRRALVRMANGRLQRVAVGDTLDGGQVVSISDNALNYVKRGRTITIAIPQG